MKPLSLFQINLIVPLSGKSQAAIEQELESRPVLGGSGAVFSKLFFSSLPFQAFSVRSYGAKVSSIPFL